MSVLVNVNKQLLKIETKLNLICKIPGKYLHLNIYMNLLSVFQPNTYLMTSFRDTIQSNLVQIEFTLSS